MWTSLAREHVARVVGTVWTVRTNGADELSRLVEAKLAVPSVRHGVVDRPRVMRALEAGDDAALMLVAAPAGYGKTTAVRVWCASLDASVAWVTLDAGDDDPVRLWRYVATAVDRVRSGLGRAALRRLGVAGSPVEAAVDELINGLAALGSELVVVLDDLHAVTSEECLSSIDYALAHLPSNAHVLVLARTDPALRLAPLRAAGALVEVRGADLAFTAAEAHELLVVLGRIKLGTEAISGAGRAHRGLAGCARARVVRGCGPSRTRDRPCRRSEEPIASWLSTSVARFSRH